MYAIIDIETTGGNTRFDKITEIAVYVHDGEKVIDEFQTLINPERRIPYNISVLTGITDEMVANAPKFYEVAKKIVQITDGCTFVAHNVNFDYNFIRQEFKSLGYDYKRERVCTVRLSRKVLPGYRSYSLGKLCRELGIKIEGRHRAAGDALATVKLFDMLLQHSDEKAIRDLKPFDKRLPELNSLLSYEQIERLPHETGVYYFHDLNGRIIYVGKSIDIHSRVVNHLANSTTRRAIEMRNQIADISYELTGSELVALLLESFEIKKLKPLFNRAQRRSHFKVGVFAGYDPHGYVRFSIRKTGQKDYPIASFGSKREARGVMEHLAMEHELCRKLAGVFDSQGACFHYTIHQCYGACIQKEPAEKYNLRAQKILQKFRFEQDNLIIVDTGRNEAERAIVAIENGKYCGFGFVDYEATGYDPGFLKELVKPFPDNRDVRNIIMSHLRNRQVEDVIAF